MNRWMLRLRVIHSMGTKVFDVELQDGSEELIEVPDYIGSKTRKKMMQQIDMTTRIKNGETEHEIHDSANAAQQITSILLKRALRADDGDLQVSNLSQSAKNKLVRYYGDLIDGVEAQVSKKGTESSN